MKQRQFDQRNEIMISAEELEQANLTGFDRLELHLLNQAVVIFPGEMTASELIEVSDSLLKLVTGLVDRLLKSCSDCDNCGQQEPCALMSGKYAFSIWKRKCKLEPGCISMVTQWENAEDLGSMGV